MAFYTDDELKTLEISLSATEVPSFVVTTYREEATDELTKWCGETAVEAVAAETGTNALKTRQFRKAQRLIFKAKILLWHAARYRSGGVQKSEKDLNDSSVNSYESMEKARQESADLMREARESVESYILTENINEPAFDEGVALTDSCSTCCDV